ncbi:MAG: TetR/AcrR family transcriptional regulator [Alphaproteobacteria bacterium]|nr:TetR/AcrR family transcriptional regulator [Alphaproteobacteria bacterium]
MTKKIHILNAAAKVFYERGARKTNFGDIAKEAGISRPTLYAAFEDKNAIMIAAIYHASEQLMETISGQIADKLTAEERLALYTNVAIIEPYKLIQRSEDAADILSGHNEDGKKAIRETLELRSIFLKKILAPFAPEVVTEDELLNCCRTFVLSGSGLKNTVSDENELQQCLKLLSSWLLRHLNK